MKIGKKIVQAVEICKLLAAADSPMSLVELGEAIGLPPAGVQQLMLPLLREEIVVSRRGRHGGYVLQKKKASVGMIVVAFTGDIGNAMCPDRDDESEAEREIRRKIRKLIGSRVERLLRGMKLGDI
jgi:DNA-binding IscR family transcriptional regulator